ncbi:uncharacterized protein BDZ83DRAFT_621041 [Colletotrichum acutatum]|uniref:Uncharacterized protein n=1 Tax=Glomerella acutata TaxID=27357 RepID=A0AAD8ULJ4_GLOAC|nr:uncharacterized protein BDZ83DRAFT_621041 [Colletotrichum acutatum]KAK1725062.1 hypothetical protein BDZ83DRAFT_621041 [Colletotrichum acutatum]
MVWLCLVVSVSFGSSPVCLIHLKIPVQHLDQSCPRKMRSLPYLLSRLSPTERRRLMLLTRILAKREKRSSSMALPKW